MENDLIALLRHDDQKALKALFDQYHGPLCSLAYRMVQDRDQAKDIVQEVFIKLWKNRQRLEINDSLNAYLKRATINTSLNHIERVSRFTQQQPGRSDLLFHSRNTADQELNYNELAKRVEDAILELPVRARMVYTLIRSEELSYKEVAETLDISVKAVEKEMMKALNLLRHALSDYLPLFAVPFLLMQ